MAASFEITPTDVPNGAEGAPLPAWDPKGGSHPRIADNDDPVVVLAPAEEAPDKRPASERIASAVQNLPGQRAVVLAVLNACREQCEDDAVAAVVAEAQRNSRSVYGPQALCSILERAGALSHVDGDGNPYRNEEVEPVRVVEDGVEYLQAAEPPVSYWVATEEGLAFADADDPLARTLALLDEQARYAPIYQYLLGACAGGAATKALSAWVDSHELTQEPRLYVAHFLHELEESGALEWRGAWTTTDTGEEVLARLG
ncbi:hypothetical protein [uncultured Adlercreutzia sp.]|uniref:hypothetical protein n=1 Tax=uncultured Adlercreutzia sp. TaxID=875803 RepID=UPI0026F401B8|nr:hypothetical protein [uncultured Adlercreutzia sp.]